MNIVMSLFNMVTKNISLYSKMSNYAYLDLFLTTSVSDPTELIDYRYQN